LKLFSFKHPEELSDRLKLPMGYLGNVSFLTVSGRNEVEINGCRGLIDYEDEYIRLRLCDCTLLVGGSSLTLKTYYGNQMVIAGKINRLEFEGQ